MATAKQDAGAKKAATKQTTTKSSAAGTGIHAPVQPSKELGDIVGHDALPRSQVISKVWDHIKANNLQNPENRREILADSKLEKIFGKAKATMFEMNKHISAHVKAHTAK